MRYEILLLFTLFFALRLIDKYRIMRLHTAHNMYVCMYRVIIGTKRIPPKMNIYTIFRVRVQGHRVVSISSHQRKVHTHEIYIYTYDTLNIYKSIYIYDTYILIYATEWEYVFFTNIYISQYDGRCSAAYRRAATVKQFFSRMEYLLLCHDGWSDGSSNIVRNHMRSIECWRISIHDEFTHRYKLHLMQSAPSWASRIDITHKYIYIIHISLSVTAIHLAKRSHRKGNWSKICRPWNFRI